MQLHGPWRPVCAEWVNTSRHWTTRESSLCWLRSLTCGWGRHRRNAIALALIALGDMEASRRELNAALELCHAVRQRSSNGRALLLCTTFASLADHSVKIGQMQEAMRWVRQLRRTDTVCLDAHSQRVWTARAGSIQASIHARLGLTCLFGAAEGAVADSGSSEDECAQCSSEPLGKDLQWHRSESMEALLTRADVLGQAGNVTGMCELLLEASRRYMVETRELGKAISCLETACRVLQGSEATNILARSTMLLGQHTYSPGTARRLSNYWSRQC